MPRQYTFKTTRHTAWVDEILEQVDSRERSSFIRDMIILGMKSAGIIEEIYQKDYFNGKGVTTVAPLSLTNVTKVTQVEHKLDTTEPPKEHKVVTKEVPEDKPDIPAPIVEMDEPPRAVPKEVDIDKAFEGLLDRYN